MQNMVKRKITRTKFEIFCKKDNNNITQRRKSFVKSKTLTDKVRSSVPDNISVQRPKNMIKPATRGPKVFPH
jgi:hypothetical protein